MTKRLIRKVAVLGAGVMGAQIAAHMANANIPVVLFELAAKDGDPNGLVHKAIEGLKKLEPSPLATKERAANIQAANYDQHLELLRECDVVIEAISERMDWKTDLYRKVAPHLGAQTIFASNTSGLSINGLSAVFPEELRHRFCGIHFFNPPRYMALVELIPTTVTDPDILDELESFLVTSVGKGVIRAKDTPNFIANRVGVFSILAVFHHAARLGLGFDEVDALTGPAIGRPKSATFRTADVVGLDTMAHVIKTMQDTLADDPWHRYYGSPDWLTALIAKGALGQKTRAGVYRKVGKEIHVLDLKLQDYRPSTGAVADEVGAILKIKNPAEKFAALRASHHPQGQFLWAIFRDVFHYCAVHLQAIADNARDLDLAIRWGFGWKQGPFETWQAAGWADVAAAIDADRAAGATMSDAALPAWVGAQSGVHSAAGSYAPADNQPRARSTLPVYRRQAYPDPVLGERASYGETVWESDAVRLWHGGDDIAVLSFKTKVHTISDAVLDGVLESVALAEKNFVGLVVWQSDPPFSAGANIQEFLQTVQSGQFAELEQGVAKFQRASQSLKYALVPTVAAVQGLALGGGCEFVMHCSRVVAALETYIGLVEVGVGVLPAGGGLKELVLRAANEAKGGDIFPFIKNYFMQVAMGEAAKSAQHARQMHYLREGDVVVMNPFELLHVARAQVRALAEAGYRPPLPPTAIPVVGKTGIATLRTMLVNMREGGFISDHDLLISTKVAEVLCGGEVEQGDSVNEDWLLRLERTAFVELAKTEKSQQRIEYMLKNGKPLRN